jgi:intracellular sulfur oxidation DsrE/DsrF family protein
MHEHDNDTIGRRSLMTGMGIAVAAGLVAGTASAQAETKRRGARFEPARHKLDAWFDDVPGHHRVFIDSASAEGGAYTLGYAFNLRYASEPAYKGEPADFAIVICFRHFSTPFGFGDALWAKYGQYFNDFMSYPDPVTKAAPTINLMNSTAHKTLGNRGETIDMQSAKGTQFAVCNTATMGVAGLIASRTGGNANEIHDELVAGAIKGARFVPAGVVALTRAQEYGYSVLIAG